ncbi:HPr kinase/phosphorylase [Geomicrobium halophilum]|uniref:HPr kinase/phosphorylase n=1 Tax=Geomicrobium halophilum TaxID=549000 RepID=A0A841PNC2_9BACL|nr:HPr(Ser) kinase/phosphatase [Geomicrobium halophilum]MBB6450347.1 HPr kinase/phosphorylase [Geomicrobium halophilum]
MTKVTARELIDRFSLELLSGDEGIYRPITMSDISRPGMEMTGYFTYYPRRRLQVLGRTELTFLERLDTDVKVERLDKLCTQNTPGIIISRNLEAPPELINASEHAGVPLMRADVTTTRLISQITNFLEAQLAETTAVHGVLVDIYGIGVLITGASGVGKSETALDLVRRGHRLVADDSVEISQQHADTLMGRPPNLIKHLLEIRGLGIIDVMTLFGARAVRPFKKIVMNVHLELWDEEKAYDRLGIDEDKMSIIETDIPKYTIPVRPGRNLAVIVEVAAMNFRLKRMGINAAQEFSDKLMDVIEDYDRDEL